MKVTLLPPDIRLAAPFIDDQEAAALFRVDVATWREWDATGRIPAAVVVAGRPRWDADGLQQFVDAGAPQRKKWEAMKRKRRAMLRMLTTGELADYLGVAEQTVRNHSDEIPGRKHLGSRVVFDQQAVDQWIKENNGAVDLWVDARNRIR